MYRIAASRLTSIKGHVGNLGTAKFATASAITARSSPSTGLFSLLNVGRSSSFPPLGNTNSATLPNGVKIASETSLEASTVGLNGKKQMKPMIKWTSGKRNMLKQFCNQVNSSKKFLREEPLTEKHKSSADHAKKKQPIIKGTNTPNTLDGAVVSRVKFNPRNSLVHGFHRAKGRNTRGVITAWHRGGGHKRLYREIDFRRNKKDVYGRIETIEYDPNRSAHICLVQYGDGEMGYILHPRGTEVGDTIVSLGNDQPSTKG